MESLIALLGMLNSLSPLAVIALLATIIYMQVKGKTAVDDKVDLIGSNHLHGVDTQLQQILDVLQRIEVSNSENFAYLRAKVNGTK